MENITPQTPLCNLTVKEFLEISKNLNSEKPAPDGYYYMRGPEAVKLVLSLGHGTAGNFKLEEKEESQKP